MAMILKDQNKRSWKTILRLFKIVSYLHALDLKTQQKNFYIASFYELDGGKRSVFLIILPLSVMFLFLAILSTIALCKSY